MTPRVKLVTAIIGALAILAAIAGYCFDGWWRARMNADLWPLDSSRISPNIVASIVQALLVGVIAYLVWPPFRAWVRKERDELRHKVKTDTDSIVAQVHAKMDAHHAEHMATLERHHQEMKAHVSAQSKPRKAPTPHPSTKDRT